MLDDQHRAILDFERQWFRWPGAKERMIREQLGLTSVRYHQILVQLLDDPDAVRYAPDTVRRLQRVLGQRAGQMRARRSA